MNKENLSSYCCLMYTSYCDVAVNVCDFNCVYGEYFCCFAYKPYDFNTSIRYKLNWLFKNIELKKFGIRTRNKSRPDITEELLYEMYWGKGMSQNEIANELECSLRTVKRRIKKFGIETRSISEAKFKNRDTDITKEQLEEMYLKKGMSVPEIANELQCSQSSIYKRTKEFGIRIKRVRYNITSDQLEEMYWRKGMSRIEIAKELGCTVVIVNKMMKIFNVTRGCLFNVVRWFYVRRK